MQYTQKKLHRNPMKHNNNNNKKRNQWTIPKTRCHAFTIFLLLLPPCTIRTVSVQQQQQQIWAKVAKRRQWTGAERKRERERDLKICFERFGICQLISILLLLFCAFFLLSPLVSDWTALFFFVSISFLNKAQIRHQIIE